MNHLRWFHPIHPIQSMCWFDQSALPIRQINGLTRINHRIESDPRRAEFQKTRNPFDYSSFSSSSSFSNRDLRRSSGLSDQDAAYRWDFLQNPPKNLLENPQSPLRLCRVPQTLESKHIPDPVDSEDLHAILKGILNRSCLWSAEGILKESSKNPQKISLSHPEMIMDKDRFRIVLGSFQDRSSASIFEGKCLTTNSKKIRHPCTHWLK